MKNLAKHALAFATCMGLASVAQAQSISQAVGTALTSNPDILAAQSAFRSDVYDLTSRKGDFEPTLSLFGDAGWEYVDDPNGLRASDNAQTKPTSELGVVAEIPLWDGYRRANQVYASAARVDQSNFELLDASETIALLVAEQYINVARQQRLLVIARENRDVLVQIQKQASNLVEGGSLPISDLFQVESTIYAADASITEITRNLEAARVQYRALVGAFPSGPLSIPRSVAPEGSVDTLVQRSIENNYRIRMASSQVEIRGFERDASDADFLPQLSMNAGGSVGHNLDGARGDETRAFVGFGLTWTLYGGQRKDRRLSLDERRNEALHRRMAVVRDVEENARRAYATYDQSGRRAAFLRERVESNTELVRSYRREFELGTRSLLDLLIAENGLFNARFELVNSEAILSFSGYRLLAAQSRLANHFGIEPIGQSVSQPLMPQTGQRPMDIIRKGRPKIQQ